MSSRVTVMTGSSTDLTALRKLAADAEGVISALGPTNKEPDLHTRTAHGLTELLAPGSRLFGVSGAGIDVPGDQKVTRDKAISFFIQKLGGAVAADKSREYQVFADSTLDWTLVRPPRLLDGAPTGKVIHDAHKPGRSSSIRQADLAAFLVQVAEQDLHSHQAPFVCDGSPALRVRGGAEPSGGHRTPGIPSSSGADVAARAMPPARFAHGVGPAAPLAAGVGWGSCR